MHLLKVTLAGLLLLLGVPSAAVAASINWCVDIDVDYDDNYAGDRFDNNSEHKPARGFRFQVRKASDSSLVMDSFLIQSGANQGCTGAVGLTQGVDYRMEVFPEGIMNINAFEHLADGGPALIDYEIEADGNQNVDRVITPGADARWMQILAVSYGLYIYDGTVGVGVGGETFYVDHDDTAAPHWVSSTSTIWLPSASDGKYKIGHELGHGIAYYMIGRNVPGAGGSASDNCEGSGVGSRGLLHKEWHSFAISEGIATWYSVTIWNTIGNGCEHHPSSAQDFDLDGAVEWNPTTATDGLHCDEADDPDGGSPNYTDGIDWLDDLATAGDSMGCTTPVTNKGTPWDWITYWWALYADEGVPQDDIYALLDEAIGTGAGTWDTNGSTGPTNDDPWQRWDGAVTSQGFDAEADPHADHVDH